MGDPMNPRLTDLIARMHSRLAVNKNGPTSGALLIDRADLDALVGLAEIALDLDIGPTEIAEREREREPAGGMSARRFIAWAAEHGLNLGPGREVLAADFERAFGGKAGS